MASMFGWFAVLCMLFPTLSLVLGDYKIELDLRSYNNSGGRQSDGSCCDVVDPRTQDCFAGDTCDTRFNFNVRNFDTNMMYTDQTRTVGDYTNMDVVNFGNCTQFINGQVNPLVFIIPASTWSQGQEIAFNIEVLDIDLDPVTGATTTDEVATIIFRILRPSAPSATFTMYQNYTGALAALELRYRVICTTGTCGATCSQTTNCVPFQSACSTTVTPTDCGDMPCQNGGTCNTIPGGYMCNCPQAYSGQNCEDFDACFSPQCENGGTCNQVPGSNDFMCTCTPLYTGSTCTDLVPPPTDPPIDTAESTSDDRRGTDSQTDEPTSRNESIIVTTNSDITDMSIPGTTMDNGADICHALDTIMLLTLSIFVAITIIVY